MSDMISAEERKTLLDFAADLTNAEEVVFHSGDREPGSSFSMSGRKKIAALLRRLCRANPTQTES